MHTHSISISAAIAAAICLSTWPALAQDFISFQSPTGNIHCYIATWSPAEARCDIIAYTPSFRAAPRGCDLDWGNAFILAERGSGHSWLCWRHGHRSSFAGAGLWPLD